MTTVYRFQCWDITNDTFKPSHRWATKEAIALVMGIKLGDGVDVDDSHLGREVEGMTDRDFDPRRSTTANSR